MTSQRATSHGPDEATPLASGVGSSSVGKAPPLRIAAVGLGWVTTHRHLPVMRAARRSFDVVGVVDGRPGRAEAVARTYRLPRHAEARSLAQVPWINEVDAVTIGTAPMSHFPLIREALGLGLHVLTEKPFTIAVEEGRSLVGLAAERQLTLAIVHNFQFARSMRTLLNHLETGRLGAIRSISAVQLGNPRRRLPEWYQQLPLGLFYDESPHLLYLVRRVAEADLSLKRVLVSPDPDGGATPTAIDVHYAATATWGTIPVTIHCNFASSISEWHLLVHGEHFLGIVDIFRDIYLCLPNDGAHEARSVLRTSLTAWYQHWWQHLPSGLRHVTGRLYYGNEEVFRRFSRAAANRCAAPGISAEDALAVLTMQHEIVAAAEPVW